MDDSHNISHPSTFQRCLFLWNVMPIKHVFHFLSYYPYLNTHTLSLSLANNAQWNKARKKEPQFMLRLFSYGRTETCQFIQNKYNNVSSLSWLSIINGVLREILISLSINQNKWSCILCRTNTKFMCSLDRGYMWFGYCFTLLNSTSFTFLNRGFIYP